MSTLPAMEYQALYRKYRPQRFDQVIGQEHVTVTLAREIAAGRVAHAYLFTGPRGTGKTTTARLLAMALNCPDRGPDSEPCGACHSCSGVASSVSMDVMELDAASHNKVEDIRELRAGVSTVASVGGARRVFILDEAHMLTKSAANALLKTLEEPPDHVHFVLATTEPYRLLDTVRSRSQRFDFHLVPTDTLTDHLRWIAEAEGFEATDGALLAVARRAAGSVRDSLSLLEQVAARDGTITEEGVQTALGVAGPESLMKLVDAVVDEAPAAALELVAHLSAGGVDLRRFAGDALGFFRGVFLTHYSSNVREFTDEPPEVIERWQEVAGRLPAASVMRSIDLLGEALVKLREGRDERMMLELAVLKLSRPELDDRPEGLLRRIKRLEMGRPVAPARTPTAASAPAASAPAASAPAVGAQAPVETPDPPPQEPQAPVPASDQRLTDLDLDRIWPQLSNAVIERLGGRLGAFFREAVPGAVEGSTLVLNLPAGYELHYKTLSNDADLAALLAREGGRLLGRSVEIDFRMAGAPGGSHGQDAGSDPSPPPDRIPDSGPEPDAHDPPEPVDEPTPTPAPPQVDPAAAMHQAELLLRESELNLQEVQPD
ncbi:MAG: DNA polymerase III subunit gamma/tau [bacterium]|nr:DNA polymerase III subunit gamma/tau [bacterium]MDE0353951.1 DNA polymerase III subunit gamma/tau [bacterium]